MTCALKMAMPVGISPRRVMQMLELQIQPCAKRTTPQMLVGAMLIGLQHMRIVFSKCRADTGMLASLVEQSAQHP